MPRSRTHYAVGKASAIDLVRERLNQLEQLYDPDSIEAIHLDIHWDMDHEAAPFEVPEGDPREDDEPVTGPSGREIHPDLARYDNVVHVTDEDDPLVADSGVSFSETLARAGATEVDSVVDTDEPDGGGT